MNLPRKHLALFCLSVAAGVAWLAVPATAQTEKLLHAFNVTGHVDGTGAGGSVIADAAGNLYGTTFNGGSASRGVVYELSPPAPGGGGVWTETILHTFTGADGYSPAAGLVFDSAGNLYGSTAYGGNGPCTVTTTLIGCGVIFELSPPTVSGGSWSESVLYNFQFSGDSSGPRSELIFDSAGNLYGTASGNGFDNSFQDQGTVFELSPPATSGGAWTETTLYNFPTFSSGQSPFAPLTFDAAGNLYGTTFWGGNSTCPVPLGCGVVFELSPPAVSGGAWTETVLHTFNGGIHDGENPIGGLIIDPSGLLFGTANRGGAGSSGTVFGLHPPATTGGSWSYITLYTFAGGAADGATPYGRLTFGPGRVLYGTTSAGTSQNSGSVYRLTPPTGVGLPWTETILHAFQGAPHDGATPFGGVTLRNGVLVGATLGGGLNGGTVYAVIP